MNALSRLEQALITNDFRSLESDVLIKTRLNTFAYASLPKSQRSILKQSTRVAALKHQIIKNDVVELCHACHQSDIKILIFKGFALAEFYYASPEQRFYSDVDILVHDDDLIKLRELALGLGWRTYRDMLSYDKTYHEPLGLVSPRNTHFDVHRFILPQHLGQHNKRRLTELAWQSAQQFTWAGTTVYTLSPVMAALCGLILARAWTTDRWNLKPHDYLDLQCLQHAGLTESELLRVAQSLSVRRTTALFLTRCNPWQQQLTLNRATSWQRLRWRLWTFQERPDMDLLKFVRVLLSMTREAKHFIWALRYLPRNPVISTSKSKQEHLPRYHDSNTERAVNESVHGIYWGSLLWRVVFKREQFSRFRALALYHSMISKSLPAILIKGQDAQGRYYHWVEHQGEAVTTRDLEIIQDHQEVERFPADM